MGKFDANVDVLESNPFIIAPTENGKSSKSLALGELVRAAHRAYGRALQERIARYGINIGQWSFLKALWVEDGITQRELSRRVGMMEPTTVTALNVMEQQGLVTRVRNTSDRRKINVFLTDKARKMRTALMTLSADVDAQAKASIKEADLQSAVQILSHVVNNLSQRNTDL